METNVSLRLEDSKDLLKDENPMRCLFLPYQKIGQGIYQLQELMVFAERKGKGSRSNLSVPIYEEDLIYNNPKPAENILSLLNFC